jgi:hypothetical protein
MRPAASVLLGERHQRPVDDTDDAQGAINGTKLRVAAAGSAG